MPPSPGPVTEARAIAIATAPPATRRVPAHLLMLSGILGVALLAEFQRSAILYGVLAMGLTIGLVPALKDWAGRRSGKLALLLAVGAILGTLAVGGNLLRIAVVASRMSEVVVLVLCVALIRPALVELRLDHAVAAMAARVPWPFRGGAVVLGVTIAGLGLSFGAVSVFGGSLRGRTGDDAIAARAAMQGLALSMILGPSNASVAAVMATFPGVAWGDALLVGLPIAVAGIVVGAIAGRRLTIAAEPASTGELTRAVVAILAVPTVAVALHLASGLSMTLAIAASAVLVAALLLSFAIGGGAATERGGLTGMLLRSDRQVGEAWKQASAETALFLACGLFMGFMREPAVAEPARAFVAAVLPLGYAGLLVMMVGVPLASTLGIHPMAPFAILAPVLTPSVLGIAAPGVFQAWIVAIGLSLVVSPASILTVTTVSSFGVPAERLGLRWNGIYAASVAAIATGFLLFLSR